MWVCYGIFILLLLTSWYKALSGYETKLHNQVVVHWSYLRDCDEQSFQESWLTPTDHRSRISLWQKISFGKILAKHCIKMKKKSRRGVFLAPPWIHQWFLQGHLPCWQIYLPFSREIMQSHWNDIQSSFPLIQASFVKLTQLVQFDKISHAWYYMELVIV